MGVGFLVDETATYVTDVTRNQTPHIDASPPFYLLDDIQLGGELVGLLYLGYGYGLRR